MKKFIMMLGLLAVSVGLYACGDTKVGASLPNGFEIITEDSLGNGTTKTLKHIETKCYYTVISGRNSTSAGGVGMVQMFIEKDGVSVPYCE